MLRSVPVALIHLVSNFVEVVRFIMSQIPQFPHIHVTSTRAVLVLGSRQQW